MIKVGLTGNFYSEYDLICKHFEKLNIPIFDADLVLKFMINYSPKIMRIIQTEFGDIYKFGLLDFKKINTREKFDDVLDIIQPELIHSYERWRKNIKSPYTIFKSCILFERKLNNKMNYNISVFRPQNERKNDLISKTFMPIQTVNDILSNELSESYKNSKSEFVIHNYSNWTIERDDSDIKSQVFKIHKTIIDTSGL